MSILPKRAFAATGTALGTRHEFFVACRLRNSRISKLYRREGVACHRQLLPSELDVFIVDVADTAATNTLAETLIHEDWAVQRVTTNGVAVHGQLHVLRCQSTTRIPWEAAVLGCGHRPAGQILEVYAATM